MKDTKTENERVHALRINAPLRVSNTLHDRTYVEYLLDSRSGKINKLAYLGSSGFNLDYMVGKDNYANIENNFFSAADSSPILSNERIKNDLAREFFLNPEEYSLKAVNIILKDIEKKYSFTPKELEDISKLDSTSAKKRQEMLKFIQSKTEIGDKTLLSGLQGINSIYETYRSVLELSEESSMHQTALKLRKHFANEAFSNDSYNWDDLGEDRREVKDKIGRLAASGNVVEIEEMLETIGYNDDKNVRLEKAKSIVQAFQESVIAHDDIQERIEIASLINSDIQTKEQTIALKKVSSKAKDYYELVKEMSINKEKLSDEKLKDIKNTIKSFKNDFLGESNSFMGIIKEIDKVRRERFKGDGEFQTLESALTKISEADIHDTKSAREVLKIIGLQTKRINRGINIYLRQAINNSINEGVSLKNLPSEEKAVLINELFKNHDALYESIIQREKARDKDGKPFSAEDFEELNKKFEKRNNEILLGNSDNSLVKEVIKKGDGIISDIGVEVDRKTIENAAEIMNACNIAENPSIDVQPDEIDSINEQSVKIPALKEGIKQAIKNKNESQKIQKDSITHQVSEIAGVNRHIQLKDISKRLNSGIGKIILGRETLSHFKSCLANSVVAKTNVETLASTSAQCADKLLNDLKQDMQRMNGYLQQFSQGLASVLPFQLFMAIRAEYTHFVEQGFIRDQEKAGKFMIDIMQDLNTSRNNSDKEARLELLHNKVQGGVSFTTENHAKTHELRNSLAKENIADELSTTSFNEDRSVLDILHDNDYKIEKEKIEYFNTPKKNITKDITKDTENLNRSDLDFLAQSMNSMISSGDASDARIKEIKKFEKDIDEEIAKTPTENYKAYLQVSQKNGIVNKLFKKDNIDVKSDNAKNIDNTNIKHFNGATIEYALVRIHEEQQALTAQYIQDKVKDRASDKEYHKSMKKMEYDKKTLQKELILISLNEMLTNSNNDNQTQPKTKIETLINKIENTIDNKNVSKGEKKAVISEALEILYKNNSKTRNVFTTLRNTNSLLTVRQLGENSIDVIQTATGNRAYFLDVYEKNKKFLKDTSNSYEKEKNIAYEALQELTKNTALESETHSFNNFGDLFLNETREGNLREVSNKIKQVQNNERIATASQKLGFS